MKAWIIKKLGGFPTIDSAIEAIREKDTRDKYKILTLAVKKLFNTVSADDILKQDGGTWMFEGKPLSQGEVTALKKEFDAILNTRAYKVIDKELKYQANKAMFIESKTEMDIAVGKVLLYMSDILKTVLKRM